MLIEDYVLGGCRPGSMVATAHTMSDGREERVARYKEERRRELEARYGPRISHDEDNDNRHDKSDRRISDIRPHGYRERTDSIRERTPSDVGIRTDANSDVKSPADSVRSTRASRLRTQANQLAQGHIVRIPQPPDPLRPKSVEISSPESNQKEEEGDKISRRKWKVTRSFTADPSSPTSQQSSANSSPNNERKTKGRYVGGSRSLSPGGISNALGKTKPSSSNTTPSSSSSHLPKSSQLVRKANNSRLSPGRRVETNSTSKQTIGSSAVTSTTQRERKTSSSPARDRPPSHLPLRQTTNGTCRLSDIKLAEISKFAESARFSESSKYSESPKVSEVSCRLNINEDRSDDETTRVTSPPFSPLRHRPAGILKKSSLDETSSPPISILKRKSSRDEGVRCVSPVKWSSEPVHVPRASGIVSQTTGSTGVKCTNGCNGSLTSSINSAHSRGILKKHRSLDEPPPPHTSILESIALNNGIDEMKPILKGQVRRCSLEELKRNQSPDSHPQGILKRKTSTGGDEQNNHEISDYKDIPQSILKRKGSSPIRSHPVSPARDSYYDDSRRPILKKKSSCEDPPDSPLLDSSHPPRPILKKKSIDEEENLSLIVRPILKTKYLDEPSKMDSDIKPILKHSEDVGSPSAVVFRSNSVRSVSSYQVNRRSLDPNFTYMRPRSPTSGDRPARPLSIAERIYHLESTLEPESRLSSGRNSRMEDDSEREGGGGGLSRSSSVSERASMWNKLEQESKAAAQAAQARRVPKGTRGRSARGDAPARFNTQPVTLGEVERAKRNNQQQQLDCVAEDDEPSRLSLAERVRLFSSQSQENRTSVASKLPPVPAPRRNQPIAHSATSSIVSGLLKNLRDKHGSSRKETAVKSPGWESSDDDDASSDSSDTESIPSVSSSPPRPKVSMVVGMVGGGGVVVRRCATEPMDRVRGAAPATAAPGPQHQAKDVSDESDGTPVVTIAERLAALQRSGTTDWRKRVKPVDNGEANGGVADRLNKLETASQGWKSRVEAKDNMRFTVIGKMASVPSSPVTLLPPQIRAHPSPQIFSPQGLESMSTPVSPEMGDNVLGFLKRSASAPGSDHLKRILNTSTEVPGPIVTVPEVCDEEFHSFFPGYSPQSLLPSISTEDIDFEQLSSHSSQLLTNKRRVRVQRKHHSVNPLRALAQRSDLRTEYVEVRSGIAEKERIRLNLDKLSKANPGLAVEALAGLASREELTSVVLRKSADTGPVKQVAQWTHPLLLRTKGRRHPVTCVIEPVYTRVNQGDAFTLVTPTQVFSWIGEYCNVIEKSRATEIASQIQSRRDMGCLSASKVLSLDSSLNSANHEAFWKILKLPQDKLSSYRGEEAGHPDEDELFESALSQSYRVYELSNGSLVPLEQAWGRHPKIDFLITNKVMVFDFVTEVFCWCGKGSSVLERKQGSKLANELAKESGWTECGISWLDSEIKSKPPRVYSVTQHMEPIIFREKFTDWPDFNRNNISHKGENGYSPSENSNKACDIKPMIEWTLPQPDLVLESSHLGRGNKFYDSETRRYYQVSTQGVKLWRIEDYSPTEIPESEFGHFIDSHSYIIQWKYTLTVTGRELSGEPSKHLALGRDRIAYWTWQGRKAGLEGGAAALISVGMQQGAPQVTVKEGLEPPVFQALMPTAALTIHSNHLTSSWPKLYLVEPGQDGNSIESPLLRQLPVDDSYLRSAASFLYLPRASSSSAYLWHGSSTKPYYRKLSRDAVVKLMKQPSPFFQLLHESLDIVEVMEGNEPKDFFNGVVLRKSYCSEYYDRAEDSSENQVQLKMFELSLVKGVFTASPVNPLRFNPESTREQTYRFVYSQEELYNTVSQYVLIDAHPQSIWLWIRTSSPSAQALTTQLSYAVSRQIEPDNVFVIVQGAEPTEFRTLFPWWSSDLHSEDIAEGWSQGEKRLSTEEIAKLSLRTYPLHDLISGPLPAGVDPTKLELYLSEPQFFETFNMNKEEFEALPFWKQRKMKKSVSLF